MDIKSQNIVVNSCEYTPVYLIPNPGVSQSGSFVLTQNNEESQKPVTNNLKRFYENSGKLESGVVPSFKPRILKRSNPTNVVGNNLKLASFLLPKSENGDRVAIKAEPTTASSVVLKPVVTTATTNVVNTVPKVEVDRKIVRVGTIPMTKRIQPRMRPKETPTIIQQQNPSKHTSVQLLKLGDSYHSLNKLSDEQMKIVSKALNLFSDPDNIPKEPAYDPVTNTKFIYKVVSPRDLTVVGKNKIELKKVSEIKRNPVKRKEPPPQQIDEFNIEEPVFISAEPKVTRSGRTVKLPKQILCAEGMSPSQKPRKKSSNIVTCVQCSAEFCSLYRLQRHYQNNPTHMPAKLHSNLFHCLLAIVKSGSIEDQANIFIQQLEQLIQKLRSLLPCLIKKMDGAEGKMCSINDDIAWLFGMDSGKYNLNMEALNCVKDKDGHCIHNPSMKSQLITDRNSQNGNTSNHEINEVDTEDCARINSVDKWPTASKRIWKLKQQRSQKLSAKKMRIISESENQNIELGVDDLVTFTKTESESAINVAQINNSLLDNNIISKNIDESVTVDKCTSEDQSKKSKPAHIQFHSTHFDIRSSPIKPSALCTKFQIDPKISSCLVQIMRPLDLEKINELSNKVVIDNDTNNIDIFKDNDVTKSSINNDELNFDTHKEWVTHNDVQDNVNYLKTNLMFGSGLTLVKENNLIQPSLLHISDKSSIFETPSKSIEPSLLSQKDESNDILFEQALNGKTDSLPVNLLPSEDNSLIDSAFLTKEKTSDIFEVALSHVKARSSNLFDTGVICDKDQLIGPPLIDMKPKSGFFNSLSHGKDVSLMEPMLLKEQVSLDVNLMNGDSKDNIDEGSNLSSSQNQSMLNFLETLGNELAYPETEIRTNTSDFQLDLFSFNSS